MKVTVNFTGKKEIDELLKKLPEAVSDKVLKSAHTQAAKLVVNKAKLLAPEGLTGNLIDSIGVVSKVKGAQKSVRTPKGAVAAGPRRGKGKNLQGHHAHLVEYGTVTRQQKNGKVTGVMPAKPFMKPAWESTKDQVKESIREEVGKSTIKTMKRTIKKAK